MSVLQKNMLSTFSKTQCCLFSVSNAEKSQSFFSFAVHIMFWNVASIRLNNNWSQCWTDLYAPKNNNKASTLRESLKSVCTHSFIRCAAEASKFMHRQSGGQRHWWGNNISTKWSLRFCLYSSCHIHQWPITTGMWHTCKSHINSNMTVQKKKGKS